MSDQSHIEWTDATWNPVAGCTRVNRDCDNCYAVAMTHRLEAMGQEKYAGLTVLNNKGDRHFNGTVRTDPSALEKPLHWKSPRRIFVNSMSDLFHKNVPFEFIDRVFAVMALTPQHTYQVLTKRPERAAEYFASANRESLVNASRESLLPLLSSPAQGRQPGAGRLQPPVAELPLPNLWLGTSCGHQEAADAMIPHLLRCPAAVRFLSCEPLTSSIDLRRWMVPEQACNRCNAMWDNDDPRCPNCSHHDPMAFATHSRHPLHWVICGGESGSTARPCNIQWIRDIVKQCQAAGVKCFCKQVGSVLAKELGSSDSKGGDMSCWPTDIQVREFPNATGS